MKIFAKYLSRERLKKLLAFVFWVVVWHLVSVAVHSDLIFVSPVKVISALAGLITEVSFWRIVWHSFSGIMAGFFLALVLGIGCAVVAARLSIVRYLLSPLTSVIKATPVASFIILALFWFGSARLAVFTSFLMVLPVIYTNVLEGIGQTDKALLEMAAVFQMKPVRRILYVYLPSVRPYLLSACKVALGLCWKAGIAAEVIGQPKYSIGGELYNAKIFLETADLLAWTVVIVIISVAFEKVFTLLIGRLLRFAGSERGQTK